MRGDGGGIRALRPADGGSPQREKLAGGKVILCHFVGLAGLPFLWASPAHARGTFQAIEKYPKDRLNLRFKDPLFNRSGDAL